MGSGELGLSEGAPVPFPRQARRNAASLVIRTLASPLAYSFRRRVGCQTLPPCGRFKLVFFPLPIHSPAMSTSPMESPVRMIVPVLIERYLPHGMLPTKHIPTVPTMMPSLEETKGLLADRCVADGGLCVRLPVIARGRTGYFGEAGDQYRLL